MKMKQVSILSLKISFRVMRDMISQMFKIRLTFCQIYVILILFTDLKLFVTEIEQRLALILYATPSVGANATKALILVCPASKSRTRVQISKN